jgi:DNA gyrase subunit B
VTSARQNCSYDANSIRVLPEFEAIRKNPAMYVGSTGAEGAHRLAFELIDNAVDEAMAGHCTKVLVTVLADDRYAVEDDGRGIPVDVHPTEGIPACEVALTRLHAGGKFGLGAYGLTAGMHGIGLACVNALSESLRLDVCRDGYQYCQLYEGGTPTTAVKRGGATDRRGTRIEFKPDAKVFGNSARLSTEVLASRLEELAFLNRGLSLSIYDATVETVRTFQYFGGLTEYIARLNVGRGPVHEHPVMVQFVQGDLELNAAMQWTASGGERVRSYVNGLNTCHGGEHVEGLRRGVLQAVSRHAVDVGLMSSDGGERISLVDVMEGLTCILSLRMANPSFESQTKTRLTSKDLSGTVELAVEEQLGRALRSDAHLAAQVVNQALSATRARLAARSAGRRVSYERRARGFEAEVYRKQFGARSRNWHDSAAWITDEQLLAKHAEMLKLEGSVRLLDVCCGSGVVGAAFKGKVASTTGLDITPEMVTKARERLGEVRLGNVYALPFSGGEFDVVVTREVLHILPEPEKPVQEVFRVLRPGGQFITGHIVPYSHQDAAWMFRVFKKKQPLISTMLQEEDIRALLTNAGFVDLEMREYCQWESIDVWTDSVETTPLHRREIRELFKNAPREARAVHPFEIAPTGEIRDKWRWCVFSGRKPTGSRGCPVSKSTP